VLARPQEWLRTSASQVSQVLQTAAIGVSNDQERSQILGTYADLCATFVKNEIPYGFLVGYVFQTGTPIERHYFELDGRKIPYIMPSMKWGCNVRETQFVEIAKQGLCLLEGMLLGARQHMSVFLVYVADFVISHIVSGRSRRPG
jgi:hypothetical protein